MGQLARFEIEQDSSSLPLLDGLDLKLCQLIAAEGAANRKRQHNVVALRRTWTQAVTTECDNPTRILTEGGYGDPRYTDLFPI
jgi:hypothetical protein